MWDYSHLLFFLVGGSSAILKIYGNNKGGVTRGWKGSLQIFAN